MTPTIHMSFQVLNRLKFTNRLGQAEVTFIDRGALTDRTKILGCDITELKPDHLTFKNEKGTETFIPLHRVTEVRVGPTVLWKKRE